VRLRAEDEQGFSLIELTMVVSLMGVIGGLGGNALLSTLRASDGIQQRAAAIAEVRALLDTVARDVRAANPLGSAPTATSLGLSLYCSATGVADCSSANRRPVSYAVAEDRLTRTTNGVASTVLDRDLTSSAVFQYLDAEGDAVASPVTSSCVRQVRISLAVTTQSGDRVDDATTVILRNATASTSC
jgi:prepilin-type N-terminal cleavage/methylation domain-containing protein